MLWIPITFAAAALQTARNAFQRGLTGALSPIGATYTRFAFGFPFAALYAACVFASTGVPAPGIPFFAWVTLGGVAQILGTASLMLLFRLRSFSTGIAFSKSEILQVALVGILVLGDAVSLLATLAIGVATGGLVLLSREPGAKSSPRASPGGLRCSGWPPVRDSRSRRSPSAPRRSRSPIRRSWRRPPPRSSRRH